MTPLQQRCLDLVRERLTEAGYSPTTREIADQLGLPSEGSARGLVDALIRQKKLARTPGAKRNLVLPGAPDLTLVATSALRAELARRGASIEGLSETAFRRSTRRFCAADGCDARVVPGRIFCKPHWYCLPEALRHRIFGAFRRKDEAAYGRAFREAVDLLGRAAA